MRAQSNSTSGVSECLGWGPGAGLGCPWAASSLSHVLSRIHHSSRRMPQPRCLIVDHICPCRMATMNKAQMEQGGCNAKVEAERLPSPSFWKSFTRPLRELSNNVTARKSVMSTKADMIPRFSMPQNSPCSPHCLQRFGLCTTS